MAGQTLNRWLDPSGDVLLTSMEGAKEIPRCAIDGILDFSIRWLPTFLREVLATLRLKCIYLCRFAAHAAHLAGLAAAWLVIVLAPVVLLPGAVTICWIAFTLIGSVWGIRREFHKHLRVWWPRKETTMSEGNGSAAWVFKEIPVEEIDRDPQQPRRRFDEGAILALGQNMKEIGQQAPVLVFEIEVPDSTRSE